MNKVYDFLNELKKRKLHYTIASYRDQSIMITVSVPGERWECEFFENDSIEIEIFKSDGNIFGEDHIKVLYDI